MPKFQRIVADYLVKLGQKLTAMQLALESGDWQTLAELAHWLKGSGGTVGFNCLTTPAAELERYAREANGESARRVMNGLVDLAGRIAPAQEPAEEENVENLIHSAS